MKASLAALAVLVCGLVVVSSKGAKRQALQPPPQLRALSGGLAIKLDSGGEVFLGRGLAASGALRADVDGVAYLVTPDRLLVLAGTAQSHGRLFSSGSEIK